MHVVNYPEGGWAIISATRDYFPVLAHSDEGYFDLETVSLSGVEIWMAETKDAIRVSDDFDIATKAQVRSQWLTYEEASRKTSEPQTRNWQAMSARINQLAAQYPYPNNWNYMSLYDASSYIEYNTYQAILYEAILIGSPPEYTIVGVRGNNSLHNKIGPLVTINNEPIEWRQGSPYNDFAPANGLGIRYPAGCAAIAVASIMKYHKYSAIPVSWNGYTVNLNGNDLNYNTFYDNNGCINTTNSIKALIRHAAQQVNMNWGFPNGIGGTYSWATPRNVASGLRYYGYNVNLTSSYSPTGVGSQIIQGKPVIMVGNSQNWPLPSPLDLLDKGHYWVCSGVKRTNVYVEYFVEFYWNGYYSDLGYYTPTSPANSTTTYITDFFMNWGQKYEYKDGWYFNNVNPNGYQYARQNFYISK